jgi:hypothetical protein
LIAVCGTSECLCEVCVPGVDVLLWRQCVKTKWWCVCVGLGILKWVVSQWIQMLSLFSSSIFAAAWVCVL